MESNCFVTPNSKMHGSCPDKCSVCLSPIQSDNNRHGPVVKTKCEHYFHESCLTDARRWKSECPMCRAALSPLMMMVQQHQQMYRDSITQAASRARTAVRRAMVRDRHQHTQVTVAAAV